MGFKSKGYTLRTHFRSKRDDGKCANGLPLREQGQRLDSDKGLSPGEGKIPQKVIYLRYDAAKKGEFPKWGKYGLRKDTICDGKRFDFINKRARENHPPSIIGEGSSPSNQLKGMHHNFHGGKR